MPKDALKKILTEKVISGDQVRIFLPVVMIFRSCFRLVLLPVVMIFVSKSRSSSCVYVHQHVK